MILIEIAIIILNIIYLPFKLLKTKNKITLISRQSNKITIDFKLLKEELEKEYEVIVLTKKLESGILNKIKYVGHMFRQMYHISTSKVVILDTYCIAISVLKHKKNLKVIQMWHAMGAFKKFGYSILDKNDSRGKNSYKLAKTMKMHKNYDYVFTSSEECAKYFAEAFNVEKNKVLVYPLPRVDLLNNKKYLNNKKEEIYKKYSKLNNKKNILYVPTWRKEEETDIYINKLIECVNFDKYNLIIKLHPLSKIEIKNKNVIIDKKFTSLEMLSVSDYIITDYSAIIYEVALLNKPIYFYAYDLEKYMENRDFYFNYKDVPGLIANDPNKLIKNIEKNSYDKSVIKDFSKKYIKHTKSATKDIINFIKEISK